MYSFICFLSVTAPQGFGIENVKIYVEVNSCTGSFFRKF